MIEDFDLDNLPDGVELTPLERHIVETLPTILPPPDIILRWRRFAFNNPDELDKLDEICEQVNDAWHETMDKCKVKGPDSPAIWISQACYAELS